MTGRPLPDKEQADYVAGGFRLEGPPLSEAKVLRGHLALARRLLKTWGADARSTRAVLAAPSAHAVARRQRGITPVPVDTLERIEVVLALFRRLLEPGGIADVRPLPPLSRPAELLSPRATCSPGAVSPTSSRCGASSPYPRKQPAENQCNTGGRNDAPSRPAALSSNSAGD